MARIVLDVRDDGAVAAVRDLLWRLMASDVVQGLLVPLQTHPHEAPAPTLIKKRGRLNKANPLAPVMPLNSAKIATMLLAQGGDKRLAAVMRPCEVRALETLAAHGLASLSNLITVSIDCLGSHEEEDYRQRAALWGDDVTVRETLRWSRRGQIAPYRFRPACQMCVQPFYDQADIVIGLFGLDVRKEVLVMVRDELADKMGLVAGRNGVEAALSRRRETIAHLVAQRQQARQRLLHEIEGQAASWLDLAELLGRCTLCGECQGACPLTALSDLDMTAYEGNSAEYVAARLRDMLMRAEMCAGCGMCEAACPQGLPLLLLTQMLAERPDRAAWLPEGLS